MKYSKFCLQSSVNKDERERLITVAYVNNGTLLLDAAEKRVTMNPLFNPEIISVNPELWKNGSRSEQNRAVYSSRSPGSVSGSLPQSENLFSATEINIRILVLQTI